MISLPKEIHGKYHPSVIVSPKDGKTYIVPDWIEVPKGTTFEQVQKIWVRTKPEPTKLDNKTHEFQVQSSNKKLFYTVIFRNEIWSCTCPRYGFKRTCKHIDLIKSKIK